jgi:type IV pilus assembly protein PilW
MNELSGMNAATRIGTRQGGLTLVELMVAMTISLLILAALVALFTNTSRSNR